MTSRHFVLKTLIPAALAVVLAACGGADEQSASTPPEPAAATSSAPAAGTALALKGDGPGCKDRAEAGRLVAASMAEDQAEYIRLWADGMQDERCRGFSGGLMVTVESSGPDGWHCILPSDDPDNRQCFWVAPDRL